MMLLQRLLLQNLKVTLFKKGKFVTKIFFSDNVE